jgi:hypothetical protein
MKEYIRREMAAELNAMAERERYNWVKGHNRVAAKDVTKMSSTSGKRNGEEAMSNEMHVIHV